MSLIALRQKQDERDIPRENFNVNILHLEETDLERSYKQFLESTGQANDFNIIKQGDTLINGREYRYLVEKNKISQDNMSNYVLFANDGSVI
ncbi:hypothetical protein CLV24_11921 [Pontibacter ummariensis]|uniref:Uncharacterized protein n=1 Tax=Pontibacter ummariensis TaxID=1610492 RepID=A0A239IV01_9BACT|nr:hypothetical protein CLV24_11921 [Pontibacter ummariensis]SNS97355.1 hypothetical protein SAMN06296052_11921 [Pontibacter ummariensis]